MLSSHRGQLPFQGKITVPMNRMNFGISLMVILIPLSTKYFCGYAVIVSRQRRAPMSAGRMS